MSWLFGRASARRIAVPALVAALGSLALPAPAAAAPAPSPSPSSKIAEEPDGLKLTHLGALNTSDGHLGRINSKGQIAGYVRNADTGMDNAVLFSAGSPVDIHTALGNPGKGSHALDVNDDGTVIGRVASQGGVPYADTFIYKDGKATRLGLLYGSGINNRGQIAGFEWIRDPDGSVLRLEAFTDQAIETYALNEAGAVVGMADMDPDRDIEKFRAFRTEPGKRLDPTKDSLNFVGETLATDVNDHGQVAGAGTDANDVHRPLIWDEDGDATVMKTPADRGGTVNAINNAGVGVGMMKAADDAPRAALYVDGKGIDLTDLVRAAGYDVTLRHATGINDLGQIAVIGRWGKQTTWDHAFLLDLGVKKPIITSLSLQTQVYPSGSWVDIPEKGAIDGNWVEVTVSVNNPDLVYPARRKLVLREKVSGKALPDGTFDVTIPPGSTVTKRVTWDTTGFAWHQGMARSDRAVVADVVAADGAVQATRTQPVVVRPTPVVMLHGFRSDAAAFDGFKQFFANQSDLYKELVFAVGDGQVPGEMNTGHPIDYTAPTLDLVANARQAWDYTRKVQERTGAWHVDYIGFSMGGIIGRLVIDTMMPESVGGYPPVRHLMQIGAPNLGSLWADALLVGRTKMGFPRSWWPALYHLTTGFMKEKFDPVHTKLKGARLSTLAGIGTPVYVAIPPWEDGDGVVTRKSAEHRSENRYTTSLKHLQLLDQETTFDSYVVEEIAGFPHGQASGLAKGAGVKAKENGAAAADGEATPADDDAVSVFATPSATVEAGKTAVVPLEVPAGTRFGVVDALPETVGLLLRDPAGQPAAQYAAGSDAAKEVIQGLNVATPQAGAWKLEITNTGTEPVTANLSAWIAGTPVKAAATVEQTGDEGRVKVSATVTDDGKPVTGATVKATLTLAVKDGAQHELTLSDDGAEGDGVYAATTEELPDGFYSVVVKAETAKGLRTANDTVEVKKPDLREFELKLSATPGGSVSASPAQEKYRVGTKVTLTATPEAGRVPIGWTVDGKKRGPGALTVVMDGEHTVQARFGTYKVTEIGTLPGADPQRVDAAALNDRGQVAAMVADKDGRRHAVRWQDGTVTDLSGSACPAGAGTCESGALGINEAGDVAGWSSTSSGGTSGRALVWRADGSVIDLQPGDGGAGAFDVNDTGQVLGHTRSAGVIWDRGIAVPLPADYAGSGLSYHDENNQIRPPRINESGAVAGGYALGREPDGTVRDTGPMLYADGVLTKLPGTVEGCATTGGRASDLNDTGLVVGTLRCGRYENTRTKRAYVWRDGVATDLGAGEATGVNDHGVIVGSEPDDAINVQKPPVMWIDGVKYPLSGVLSRPGCPRDGRQTTQPCVGIGNVLDVNESGQILVQGLVREPAPVEAGGFTQVSRAFLLTPTTARTDLKVTHTVSAAEPAPGAKVTWSATVTNTGDDAATDVRLDVFIPGTVTGAVCETGRGLCAAIKGGFRNTVKVLEPGVSATVKVSATIPAGTAADTRLTAQARAYSLEVADPQPGNNQAEATATVKHALDKTGVNWVEPVRVGSTSKYPIEVTLTNRGTDPMPIAAVKTEGPFTQTNTCPKEPDKLAPGTGCTVQLWFTPIEVGSAAGKLTFTTDGTEPAYVVTLTGRGAEANAVPVVKLPDAPLQGKTGEPFTLTVTFTDTDPADTHTVKAYWGDGEEAVAQVTRQTGGGTVTMTRTFDEPVDEGYAWVRVTDSKGDTGDADVPYVITGSASAAAPAVGKGAAAGPKVALTGTGKTVSPAHSCRLVAACEKKGEASLAVTASYRGKKGSVPVGELRYDAPGFRLRHTAYTVLVAADGTATLRGRGRVNDATEVTFEVTAVDAGKAADGDRLRLRVWGKDGGLVYDNQRTGPAPAVTGTVRISGRD
ncbi:putative membrane protein [Streptosporangium becharense]|uniref:Putative membrane protein n=1 Tax=Streptosporangium becharense TaxID=1816182 RepID=A0A7W9IL22_9ACTN|nr:CARDB domain-containing protein [Streptosporangium becharense]MBB2911459.1 putative membrane protein [Streptosporangium becharense]MBB5822723.1 putative membrane protein [Streptosporangium becharense]